MSQGIPYADILILALIAGFILLRLRSVLGNKTGNESDYFNRFLPGGQQQATPQEPIVQLEDKSVKPAKPKEEPDVYFATLTDDAIKGALAEIKSKDPLFTATAFLKGAQAAFEMVFDAFVKGDRQTLKMLMSDAIYKHFAAELDQRATEENKTETTLVSVQAKEISQASLARNVARLTVHFGSEQVTVTRNAKGDIIEGNPSAVHHVEDQWVFERDVTSKNPNWKIVET